MKKKEFKIPQVSPFIGSTLANFYEVLKGNEISRKFNLKIILTFIILVITLPFRWYENIVFRGKIKKTSIGNPIFILGHWRSGTTFLHNILSQDPNAAFVTTYQTVFPYFLASKRFFQPLMQATMPDRRPSDNMTLASHLPQEEEFALCNINPHSYYNFFYFPKKYGTYYNANIRGQQLTTKQTRKLQSDYTALLKKARINSKGDRLVIKNPVNTGRISFLNKIFPHCKFIHIYRNPFIVYLSTKRFFFNLMPMLWYHEVSRDEIESLIIDIYARLYEDYFDKIDQIEPSRKIEICFEEFEKDPLTSVKNIYDRLEINGFEQALPHFERYLIFQKKYEKNKYTISKRELDLIKRNWGVYLKRWNYGIPDEIEITN